MKMVNHHICHQSTNVVKEFVRGGERGQKHSGEKTEMDKSIIIVSTSTYFTLSNLSKKREPLGASMTCPNSTHVCL